MPVATGGRSHRRVRPAGRRPRADPRGRGGGAGTGPRWYRNEDSPFRVSQDHTRAADDALSGNCGKEILAVIVWTEHGLEADVRMREFLAFVRWLFRPDQTSVR